MNIKPIVVFCFFISITLPGQQLPTNTSSLFSGSGNCSTCHSAQGATLVTNAGEDISPIATWRSSMMAHAAKDPLWQAKVSTEVDENPHLQSIIEDKCTTCHAPLGRTEAVYHGSDYFSLNQALSDSLSKDGVSCTLCHQIQKDNLGLEDSYSGHYKISDDHQIFGPYPNPTSMPMFNQTGYTPVYSSHISSSNVCATCHTLFTPFVDDDGNVAGTFPEQTPYLEWLNSIYPDKNIECQTCHMPAVDEAFKIASRPPWLTTKRQPVWKHDFVGANTFIVSLIKSNLDDVGSTASPVHLDSTLEKTKRMMQYDTVDLTLNGFFDNDSLTILVNVTNLTGHKFPTGFPSRRAWLQVEIKNRSGEVVFYSGSWDTNGKIKGLDDSYEPHHDIITDGDQVQIYQSVMQDLNGDVTYTLLRGAAYIKDNRLPPMGFKSTFSEYEAVAVKGKAAQDRNFNFGYQDGGRDQVTYRIPAQESEYEVSVSMYYQSLSPRFANNLFDYNTSYVERLNRFYSTADKTPVLLKKVQKQFISTSVGLNEPISPNTFALINFPNPFNNSTQFEFFLKRSSHVTLEIFDTLGRALSTVIDGCLPEGSHRIHWTGKDRQLTLLPSGVYIGVLDVEDERYITRILLVR